MGIARRHHTVPKCLLLGFSTGPRKRERLTVFDQRTGQKWSTSLPNVSVETDFYRYDADGVAPDAVEQHLSQIESDAAPVLRQIATTVVLPDEAGMAKLYPFIALMFERVARMREHDRGQWNQLLEQVLRTRLGSRQDLLDGGEVKAEVTREYLLQGMLQRAQVVGDCLAHRQWTLWVHEGPSAFVCTDAPAVLDWIKPMPGFWSPGFGMGNTLVSLPISSHVLLSGRLEGQSAVLPASSEVVAMLNNQTCRFAGRFVYAAGDDFEVLLPSGQVGRWEDVVALNRSADA